LGEKRITKVKRKEKSEGIRKTIEKVNHEIDSKGN